MTFHPTRVKWPSGSLLRGLSKLPLVARVAGRIGFQVLRQPDDPNAAGGESGRQQVHGGMNRLMPDTLKRHTASGGVGWTAVKVVGQM